MLPGLRASCRRLLLAPAVSGWCADSGRTVPARGGRVGTGLEHGLVISSSASWPSAKMWPVGWEALEQWGDDVVRIEPLTCGVGVNEVWSLRVYGRLAVGRLGARSDADLAWETDLLRHLDREGLSVPVPIATRSGLLFADGLVVMSYLEGEPPETEADWRRVADSLR